jgi:uncharacterized sulfatase
VDCVTDFALDYLRSRDGRRPFFLFLSYIEPHHQNDHNRFEGPRGSREKFGDFVAPGDLIDSDGDWRESYPDYLGCINSLDRNLGRIRAELEELGISESTLLVFTSDHGCHFRTRNDEYKRSCHEASIRIPMVACGPGFRGGSTITELASLIDVAPTVLTAAGAPVPDHMRGRPLQQLLDAAPADWPQEAFLQISETQVGRAIRTRRYKYSVRAPGGDGIRDADSRRYVEDFLYDLDDDPNEQRNLVAEAGYEAVRERLRAALKRRMTDAGETEPAIERAPKK